MPIGFDNAPSATIAQETVSEDGQQTFMFLLIPVRLTQPHGQAVHRPTPAKLKTTKTTHRWIKNKGGNSVPPRVPPLHTIRHLLTVKITSVAHAIRVRGEDHFGFVQSSTAKSPVQTALPRMVDQPKHTYTHMHLITKSRRALAR